MKAGKKSSSHTQKLDDKRFSLSTNRLGFKTMSFVFDGDSLALLLTTNRDDAIHTLHFGAERWCTNVVGSRPPYSIAAVGRQNGLSGKYYSAGCFAWNGNTLEMKNYYVNWGSSLDWKITMPSKEGESMILTIKENYQEKPITLTATPL